jgi:hypothetical protein
MGIETGKYITDLDEGWPTANDSISMGDDHLRLIKAVLKNTFPEAKGPQAPNYYPELEQGSVIHNVAGEWAETDSVMIDTSGNITCANLTASGNVVSQSDDRLKHKIATVDDALDKVKTLDTFTYVPNEEGVHCGMPYMEQAGVSAQQVQAVFPQAVQQTDNGYLAVDYTRLCVLLLEAVKELSYKVENQA